MTETNPMDNISAAARRCYINKGIARSTLYRYFPGRDELLIATVKEEMLTLNGFIRERLDVKLEPAHQVVEGLLLAIREIPHRPLLATVFESEEGSR
jgi:AcrR family transcriptional regulator